MGEKSCRAAKGLRPRNRARLILWPPPPPCPWRCSTLEPELEKLQQIPEFQPILGTGTYSGISRALLGEVNPVPVAACFQRVQVPGGAAGCVAEHSSATLLTRLLATLPTGPHADLRQARLGRPV